MELNININAYSPWPGHWIATTDDYNGGDSTGDNDPRIGVATNRWDAIRFLIDALQEYESRRKVAEAKAKREAGTYDSHAVINATVERVNRAIEPQYLQGDGFDNLEAQ